MTHTALNPKAYSAGQACEVMMTPQVVEGYKPIGVVGFYTGSSALQALKARMENGNAVIRGNVTQAISNASVTLTLDVLYVRNTTAN